MTMKELGERIKRAVSGITGDDTVSREYGNQIASLFCNGGKVVAVDSVIISTLDSAPRVYDGKTKLPNGSFWKKLKAHNQRTWNVEHGVQTYEYNAPSKEDRTGMAEQAKEIAERFANMTKGGEIEEKQNMFTKKVRRYRDYAKDGVVRVDKYDHALHSQWVMRKQAIELNLPFHDPIEWLNERGIVVWC